MNIPITQIQVGERDRSDLGDVPALAASITAVGLLHPVVVNATYELVAGERRLAAVRSLGWTEVPVTVVDLTTAADVLRAEADENTARKPLTPYEASRARERRSRVLALKAEERRAETQARTGEGRVGVSNLDTPSTNAERQARATRKVAAVGTGYSGSTLDKVDRIRDVAERGVVRQGKAEIPVPEPVRAVAREALEEVKVTGAAVEKASRRVAQALAEHVDTSPDVQAARLAKSVSTLAAQTIHGLPKLDADRVAAICDDDMWQVIDEARQRVNAWAEEVDRRRVRGLHIVRGTA